MLLGMGIVFISLGLLVFLCDGIRLAFGGTGREIPETVEFDDAIPDRQKLIAAVTAAVSEYEGTNIAGMRVVSFNKRRPV